MSLATQRILAYAPAGSAVSLSGVLTGVTTAGPTLALLGPFEDVAHLVADVSAAVKTSSLVVETKWQVSLDGSTFYDLYGPDGEASATQIAPTGGGSTVTTKWKQACPAAALAYPYVALAVLSSGATGGASDIVTITYTMRKAAGFRKWD